MKGWMPRRRGANRYETRVKQSGRTPDMRRKELAGAWLLEVNLPRVAPDQRKQFADAIAHMIARQTHKEIDTRQYELELFQDYFGLEWVKRWQRIIEQANKPARPGTRGGTKR